MAGSQSGADKKRASELGLTVSDYRALISSGLKWCTACKEMHSRTSFGSDRSRPDGLAARCVASRIVAQSGPGKAERRSRAANGEAWCRKCRAWLPISGVSSGVCRMHRNEMYRATYAKDGESIRQRVYARKRSLTPIPGWWTFDAKESLDGMCAYGCGSLAESWDHIWPVSRGGISAPGNLVPACLSCNSRKKDAIPTAWVTRGWSAYPDLWEGRASLAVEHNCAQWFETWLEEAA